MIHNLQTGLIKPTYFSCDERAAGDIPRQIYITKEPVDLIPLESFKVELSFPVTPVPANYTCYVYRTTIKGLEYAQFDEQLLSDWLNGVLIRGKKCDCPIKTLMETGCQCGGI